MVASPALPRLVHPLLRAGIPSLITGHPPRCRSNAAIKSVSESGAFVQLECSAINRLRPKVINYFTKEARARTGERTDRKSLFSLAVSTSFEKVFPLRRLSSLDQSSGHWGLCSFGDASSCHSAALLRSMSLS
jgi:hypothetical protein